MEHNFRNIKTAIATLLICLMQPNGAKSQTSTVLPILSNNTWFTSSNAIQGINVAMIAGGAANIAACVYYDGGTTPTFYVNDNTIPATANIASTGSVAGVPDVIIGNATGATPSICTTCSSSNDFIMAAAFINNSGDVEVDFYDINDNGSGISISSFSSASITISPGSYMPQTVHIDAIYDAGSGTINNYVVVWDDFTSMSNPVIWAAYGDLNANTISTPVQITPTSSPLLRYGSAPDVAGIQRRIRIAPLLTDDVALFTYVNATNGDLTYREYDFTTSTFSAVTVLDAPGSSTSFSVPRIDAIDDYNYNGNPSNANYEVAAMVTSTGAVGKQINTYNNTYSGPFGCSLADDITGVAAYSTYVAGTYENFAPTVAVGDDGTSTNSYNYAILHYLDVTSTTTYPDSNMLFMEPLPFAASTTYFNNQVYWVDSTPGGSLYAIPAQGCSYSNAVAGAPDDPTQPLTYAWAYYNGSNYEVDYKQTTFVQSGGNPAFRQTPAHVNKNNQNSWQLYPNPATDLLTVSNGTGGCAVIAYIIMDVTGRSVQNGSMANGNMNIIDVSNLLPGTYLLKMYSGNEENWHTMFVKN